MHWSLTPRANLGFLLLWLAAGALTLWLLPTATRVQVGLAGFVVGTICGRLQAEAMRLNSERLLAAQSARQVQEALSTVGPGRAYRVIFYGALAILFMYSIGQGVRAPLVWIAGFCAFAFARDSITLPRVLALNT